jgi:3',5'-nucleoside bisphosphate phosphatase
VRIDLHTHSSVSDGTDSPAELVGNARAAGLDVIALTDHDTFDGWPAATRSAADAGVVVVPGVEVSTRLRGAGVHVLAYLPDPGYAPLAGELARIRDSRATRLTEMTGLLTDAGLPIEMDDVFAVAGQASTLGRPHVADAMVAKGYVADRSEAFTAWLWEGGPAYVPKYAPATDDAVRMVGDAGGVAVLAHPWARGSRRVLDAETVHMLARLGLAGIEVDHEDHDRSDRAALREIAAALDLIVTGSSDYHGAGKVGHVLGVNTTAMVEYERLLDRARRSATTAGRQVPRLGVA